MTSTVQAFAVLTDGLISSWKILRTSFTKNCSSREILKNTLLGGHLSNRYLEVDEVRHEQIVVGKISSFGVRVEDDFVAARQWLRQFKAHPSMSIGKLFNLHCDTYEEHAAIYHKCKHFYGEISDISYEPKEGEYVVWKNKDEGD